MRLLFPDGEHPHTALAPGSTRIGSDRQSDIVLDRPGVQPHHCEVRVNPQGVLLQVSEDAQVEVNNRAVSGVISLRTGDAIVIDGVQMRLGQPEAEAADAEAGPACDDMSSTMVRPTMPRHALRGLSGSVLGRAFPVMGTTLIGRGQDCHLPFNIAGLSRQHARLTPMDKGIWVEDLGSTNGCFINGRKVRSALAAPGAEIAFDELRFRVVAPSAANAPEPVAPVVPQERSVPLKWVVIGAAAALVVVVMVALLV
jgi:pSer/pThr/pTyr-binding forkhead associated (FHA) protein